ncbi:chitobiase/beta-hexosaminidase C-terminal domain-containing protein [Ruminococcus sp. OA3]|uniref:chitobiase/beta-hexosaminidase C-terminal domain-containing protein n=1 Tax=Ruminococcus sp. OA3 TaxID=2914164 RepID=UPI001F068C31|nr:chitobiase/beta-hexosaminidase C-terminal domain-containing protein [Ruminococcus sp. OA3]MCH1981634.1 chitobiase/beta-hexosaminidase C-terminal domain-containing protein [Ruminococcus sp. OA3]
MKTAVPTSYPEPGTYDYSGVHVDLRTATPEAVIHYTADGSEPTRNSPVYRQEDGLITLPSASDRDQTVKTETTIRAFAVREGWEDSEKVSFRYCIKLPARTQYRYRVMQQKEGQPTILRIMDFDRDKLYFVLGKKRGLLIDLGYDPDGDLKGFADLLAGGVPWDAIVLHGHPDHIQQGKRMLDAGVKVYMNSRDNELVRSFGYEPEGFLEVDEGYVFDLGGCRLKTYAMPGHTPGSVLLVNEETGDIFSSDAFGCNIELAPGSGWLQFGNPESAMERYLSALQAFRCKTGHCPDGRLYNGHDDHVLDARLYLNNLERAVQRAVDEGEKGLRPTLRPAADSFGSTKITIEGDFCVDLHYAALNLGILFTEGLNESNNALLSYVHFPDAKCEPPFNPYQTEYILKSKGNDMILCPISSSTNSRIYIDQREVRSKSEFSMPVVKGESFCISVTAPDGKTRKQYRFCLSDIQ